MQIPQAQKNASNPNQVDFHYYVISPVLESGWAFLGEAKFVTVSHQRFTDIQSTSTSLSITLAGTPNEQVNLQFVNTKAATPNVYELSVTISNSGSATVTCNSGTNGTCS